MRSLEEYINLPYKIEIIKNTDSTFFASIKELPGCMTEGDTVEEACQMIEDAKKIWLETAIKNRLEIPEPEVLQTKTYSGKLVLRIPKNLHKELSLTAEENDVSLNQYMNVLLSERHAVLKEKYNTLISEMDKSSKLEAFKKSIGEDYDSYRQKQTLHELGSAVFEKYDADEESPRDYKARLKEILKDKHNH